MKHSLLPLFVVLFLSQAKSQQVASSPGVLQFASLAREVPGTLRQTATDSLGNIFAVGRDSFSTFVSKRSPSLDRVWVTRIPSISEVSAAIAFSDTSGLFAIAASPPSDVDTPDENSILNIILYELDTVSGEIRSSALVERVHLLSNSRVKCILTSAASSPPLVYLTYIVQDGVNPSTARTKVVQMARSNSGMMSPVWQRELTDQNRVALSIGIVEDKAKKRILVFEISSRTTGAATDQLSAIALDEEGTTIQRSVTMTASESAWIADVAADENGALYLAEGPSFLHRVALRSLDGAVLFTKLWNVTEIEVVDMTVLRDGSALYVLSNGEGFRNEGSQVVRTKTPILSIYNASGYALFQSEYAEPIPDSEREMYSLSIVDDPKNQYKGILGGFVRLAGEVASERKVSIGLFTFPNFAKGTEDQSRPQPTSDIDSNRPDTSEPEDDVALVVIGAVVGVSVFLIVVGVALFVIYKKNDKPVVSEGPGEGQGTQRKFEEDIASLRASLREENVLV